MGIYYCSKKAWMRRFPITLWLPQYSLRYMLSDFIAGMTVALTVIPQSLAYAQIAKLPIEYGLYSAFMGCFVYCFLGTSKDVTIGPTAILSLLVATYGTEDPSNPTLHDPRYAILLALFCGIVQIILGVLHLGALTGFISEPVISGFTSASALTIALGQVKHLFGLSFQKETFFETFVAICQNIKDTNPWDLLMGCCCIVLLYVLQVIQRRVVSWQSEGSAETTSVFISWKFLWLIGTARNAIIVLSAAFVAVALQAVDLLDKISITGNVTEGIPVPDIPDFSLGLEQIFSVINSGIIIVPLIAYLETIAIGKAFARKNMYKIDPNQEMIAMGVSNVFGSFFKSYPVTGSFSRTAINSQSGVKTPAGGLVTGSLVLVALAFLTQYFYYIPKAALAAVIIVAVLKMFNYEIFVSLWKIRKLDLFPLIATFIFSLLLGVQYGTMIGIVVDLIILLYPISRPSVSVITAPLSSGRSMGETINHQIINRIELSESQLYKQVENAPVVVVHIDSAMRYPSAEFLEEKLNEIRERREDYSSHVILDCSKVNNIDYTFIQSLQDTIEDFKKAQVKLVLVHVRFDVQNTLFRADIKDLEVYTNVHEALENLSSEDT